ncbi:MAG: tetratricopeptide repeat protein [Bryobacteraceae bacterium]
MLSALLLLAALTQQPKPRPPATPASDPLAEAQSQLDAGHPQQAIVILKDLLDRNPDNYGVWFDLGVAYGLAGQNTEAAAAFRKVLALQPNLYEAQLNFGLLLLKQKQYGDAAALLTQAAAQKPREARPQLLLGQALLGAGKPAEAEARLRAVTTLDPRQAEAFFLLARALAAQEKWPDAAAAMTKYNELKPADTSAQLELAQYLEKAKKPADAAAIYRRFPHDPAALERAGVLALDLGDTKQAVASLTAALALSPTPALRYALAHALKLDGQPDKAIEVAAPLVGAQPDNLELRMFYGRLLRDQKQYAPAAEQFSAATKLKPDSLEAWDELTSMLVLLNNYPAALETLEKSRQLGGENAAYFWYRAMMLDALKQPQPALESYQRFLSLSNGQHPDEEWKARQRVRLLTRVLNK